MKGGPGGGGRGAVREMVGKKEVNRDGRGREGRKRSEEGGRRGGGEVILTGAKVWRDVQTLILI